MLADNGLDSSVFRAALAVTALTGILANFIGGWLGERLSLPRLLALSTAFLAPCLALFPYVHSLFAAIVWAIGMGGAGGIVTVVFFSIWGRFYGRLHLGKIQGVAQALTVIGSAIGPVFFAACHDWTGSYNALFYGLSPVVVVAGLACWFVATPTREN